MRLLKQTCAFLCACAVCCGASETGAEGGQGKMHKDSEGNVIGPFGLRAVEEGTARDRFWVWAHEATVYNGDWGLPGDSRITPVEGAHYLGVPNIIMIRYNGRPPFENDSQYAIPFRSLKRVIWSLVGGGGATSDAEREAVLRLAEREENITGFFMDDFFHIGQSSGPPHWLAENRVEFPVTFTISLTEPTRTSALELTQTDWPSGDYRTARFAVDASADGSSWREGYSGELPNESGAKVAVPLSLTSCKAVRIRILSTHDTKDAISCGLKRVRLLDGEGREIALDAAKVEASSSYPGHGPEHALTDVESATEPEVGSLSVDQLRALRQRFQIGERRLKLGVTLYTSQIVPEIASHLDLCDIISLWTWQSEGLKELEARFAKLERLAPGKEILLGCYMWDFSVGKPMPVDRMRKQCEFGLERLKEGRIVGMIFLATNICDLNLETVEWTRRWIAEVGEQRL